ncbi:MAG TPA: hypothetical protein VFJ16_20145, partial [Longimicrobium sp.]|nr:hypothetical protein [Longimicrobium sp.]
TRIAVLAAAALALPAAAAAQQTTPAPAQPAAPAQAAPANEAAQLQQKLGALQQRAMQDPSLKAATDSFNAVVQAGMARLDPQAPAKVARAAAISGDVTAARAASDNARLNQLATEANELQAYFTGLRQRAIVLPEVATARQAYVARLFEKMKEYDPQAQSYVDRLNQLSTGS